MQKIIRHEKYLQPKVSVEHLPELIYHRKETEMINGLIEDTFNKDGANRFTLLSGPTGCGKTLLIRQGIFQFIKKNPSFNKDIIYIDGYQTNSVNTALRHLCHSLGGDFQGKTEAELLQTIKEQIDIQGNNKLIVIDEVDKIMDRIRNKSKHQFLSSLWRMETKPDVSIIIITNKFNLQKNIAYELSAFLTERKFSAYTTLDFFEILKKRALYCLHPGSYKMEDLQKIAKTTFEHQIEGNQSNARFAMNILYESADLAQREEKKIGEVVERAIGQVKKNNYSQLLTGYNLRQLLLIESFALHKKQKSEGVFQHVSEPSLEYNQVRKIFKALLQHENLEIPERATQRYIQQFITEGILQRLNRSNYYFLDNPEDILPALNQLKQQSNVSIVV